MANLVEAHVPTTQLEHPYAQVHMDTFNVENNIDDAHVARQMTIGQRVDVTTAATAAGYGRPHVEDRSLPRQDGIHLDED